MFQHYNASLTTDLAGHKAMLQNLMNSLTTKGEIMIKAKGILNLELMFKKQLQMWYLVTVDAYHIYTLSTD